MQMGIQPELLVPQPPPLPQPGMQQQLLQQQHMPAMRQQQTPARLSFQGYSRGSVVMQGDTAVVGFNDDDPLEVETVTAGTQAEPEPDTSVDGPLSVTTRIEYSALPSGKTQ